MTFSNGGNPKNFLPFSLQTAPSQLPTLPDNSVVPVIVTVVATIADNIIVGACRRNCYRLVTWNCGREELKKMKKEKKCRKNLHFFCEILVRF
jgi:hypothetical protein